MIRQVSQDLSGHQRYRRLYS